MSHYLEEEDNALVRNLFLMNIAENVKQQQLLKYFETFGIVERLNVNPIANAGRTGCVVFVDPDDAATALLDVFHDISGCRIKVLPSYGPENVDLDPKESNEAPSAIMKLDDYCLEHIFIELSVPDRIQFARTCSRFLSIYERMSRYLYKFIDFEIFESMNAQDVKNFFRLSGHDIKNIKCTKPQSCFKNVSCLLGDHCVNLESMIIKHNNFLNLKINILRMFARPSCLQNLELRQCELMDEHLPALKYLRQLKKLDISFNNMLTGRYMNFLPNSIDSLTLEGCNSLMPTLVNEMLDRKPQLKALHIIYNYLNWLLSVEGIFNAHSCKSLEILSIYFDNDRLDEYKYIARLPRLKKLSLDVMYPENVISPKIITWLAEHKSKQLEHFEITNALSDCISDEMLLEIGKLTALHTLSLLDGNTITDRGLEALFTLPNLREINIASSSAITDNGVLRLILECPKLQVLNLAHCKQLTQKLLNDVILKIQAKNLYQNRLRPLPIKLCMSGTKVSQFALLNAGVAGKNIIDLLIT